MKHMYCSLLIIPLLSSLAFSDLSAQQTSILQVLRAGRLEAREIGEMNLRELIGNVRLQQDNVFITCDRATQNLTQNTVELSGNVLIEQDTLLLRTERGFYDANTRVSSSTEGVWLYDGHVTLSARIGRYETASRIADFFSDVAIEDAEATITSNVMRYDRDSALVIATGNVNIRFKDENVLIIADSVRHYSDERHSYFYNEPILWQIDTAFVRRDESDNIDSLRLDTLNIAAERMTALRDSSNRFLSTGNVRLVRGDFSARCEQALFLRSDSLIIFNHDPILWHAENQITGDSIAARLEENKLRSLHVIGNSFSISRSKASEQDTLYPPGRFDQTKGRSIFLMFRNDKADTIRVEDNAVSVYYLYEDGALNGVRRESGDMIIIGFDDGTAERIWTIGGVEGTYYPEKYVTGHEESYNLDGFVWREDRPAMIPYPDASPEQMHAEP